MSLIRTSSVAVLVVSSLILGCGSSSEILAQTKACTVDADCSGNGWCLDGVCQTPYGLTLSIDKAPAADGKIHVSSALNLSATVTGGTPPVEFALVDEGRLQLVGAPYSWQWDVKAAKVTEGSHRVIATAKGGTRTYLSQSIEVIVDRVAPSSPILNPVASLTNEDPVVLTGTGEEKARVRVVEGTTELAAVEILNGGTWKVDLKALPEGTHELMLTATDLAGNTSDPVAVTIVVDRGVAVPLTVVSRTPSPGATNAWSRAPIVVAFSKPVNASSLTSQSVAVRADGVDMPLKSRDLSADGRTLTMIPNPAALLPVPSIVVAELTAQLTDLAGNSLPATTWSWVLPEWQAPGVGTVASANLPNGYDLTFGMAATLGGDPVLAYSFSAASNYASMPFGVETRRWDGSAWASLGTIIGTPAHWSSSAPSIAEMETSAGSPFLAWSEVGATRPGAVLVSRLDGATWSPVGGVLNDDAAVQALGPVIRIAPNGLPIVAWREMVNGVHQLIVKRWDGTRWQKVGGNLFQLPTSDVAEFTMALDGAGNPAVAWIEDGAVMVARWAGMAQTWLKLRTGMALSNPSIAIDAANYPVVAGTSTTTGAVAVFRFNLPPEPPSFYYPDWPQVGPSFDAGSRSPSLGVHPDGSLLVAYANSTGVFARKWDGVAWNALGGNLRTATLSASMSAPVLMVGPSGQVTVGWDERSASGSHAVLCELYVKRFNR